MELLDRYLREVNVFLPKAGRRDIIAELREDIHSEIEARQAELSRPVSDDDLAQILKRWGHPLLVARRYAPNRYLIGPVLFPAYLLTLKIAFLVFPLPWLLVWIGFVIFDPSYRANPDLLATLMPLWRIALFLFSTVTVTFAIAERHQDTSSSLKDWSPRTLPVEPDPAVIPRADSIAETVIYSLMTLWWVGAINVFPTGPEAAIDPSPAVAPFYWSVLIVLVAMTALSAVNAIRPHWSTQRLVIHFALDAACVLTIAALLSAGRLVVVSGTELTSETAAAIAAWIHVGWVAMLAMAGVTYSLRALQDIRRLSGKGPIRNWAMHALGAD